MYGGGSVTGVFNGGVKRQRKDFDPVILYICPAQDRQKHTTNHQRAEHVIWIVRLLCSVVHPKALCAWIWLVKGTKEAVCSPLTSVLLYVAALWCIEKLWQGYPSQTNAQEIPLLCIILNGSLPIHRRAFIPRKTFMLNFALLVCLSTVMGILAEPYCTAVEGAGGAWGRCSSNMKTYHLIALFIQAVWSLQRFMAAH